MEDGTLGSASPGTFMVEKGLATRASARRYICCLPRSVFIGVSFAASVLASLVVGILIGSTLTTKGGDTSTPADSSPPSSSGPAQPTSLWAPLPAADAVLTRIAFGSCADQALPQPHWDLMHDFAPDLTILAGDNVYGDCRSAECAELSAAYARLQSKPSFVGYRSRLPIVAVWDDHDAGQNDGGAANPYKAKAKELAASFYDYAGTDERLQRPGLYTSYAFGPVGRRIQVILLDTRWFRSNFDCARAGCAHDYDAPGSEVYRPTSDASKTMLGAAQWQWFEERLAEPADLRLVVTSIQFLASGTGYECWRMLPHERQRMFDAIRRARPLGGNGVVLLSGDRHVGGIYRLQAGQNESAMENTAGYDVWEATASSFTHSSGGSASRPQCKVDASARTSAAAGAGAAGAGAGAGTGAGAGGQCDEPGPLRLGPLIRLNHFGGVEVDWTARKVTLSLRKAWAPWNREYGVPAWPDVIASETFEFE